MSLLHRLTSFKNKVEAIQRRFLWGASTDVRKVHWVAWNQVCQSKKQGGLGLVNLELKNRSLLRKWIWRYGEETDAFWHNVITGKYGGESNALSPAVSNHRSFSSIWKNITHPLDWIPGKVLKYEFPRIHALSLRKDGKVKKFGRFVDGRWTWEIPLRRSLFNWDMSQWNTLLAVLDQFQVCPSLEDKLLWKGNLSGSYSPKSFCTHYLHANDLQDSLWMKVWSGFLAPKVESFSFCWKLLEGKIAVKANLISWKLLNNSNPLCTFCGKETETVDHLFFHFLPSWYIWTYWSRLWGVSLVYNCNGRLFFQEWIHLLLDSSRNKLRLMSFDVIVWTIWLFRNDMVFKNKQLDLLKIIDLVKYRLAIWAKAKWPHLQLTVMDFIISPNTISMPSNVTAPRLEAIWVELLVGTIKFNVDRSAIGKPGPAGIGGVLRNHSGDELIRFSKAVGVVESNEVEYLAIREALILFLSSKWFDNHSLTIESDSSVAVLNSPNSAPWRLRNFTNHIPNLLKRIPRVEVVHIYKECNMVADALAKDGVHRLSDHVVINDS
ncbi:hypothetical protein PTKIN_Ptkin08bG0188600 [Pterospermum kingtungense]